MADGTLIDGPVGLRTAILRRPDAFVQTMTEKLMIYALGRSLEAFDMPTIRAIVRDAGRNNYRFSSLIMGVLNSTPFQRRMKSSQGERTVAAGNRALQ
jgi:hypothetical protein